MARVKYLPMGGVREIYGYVFNKDNDWEVEVSDPDHLLNMLTYPRPDFKVIGDEHNLLGDKPLTAIEGIGKARAAEFSELGYKVVKDLAALDEEKIQWLARNSGPTIGQIRVWAAEAKLMVEADAQTLEHLEKGE